MQLRQIFVKYDIILITVKYYHGVIRFRLNSLSVYFLTLLCWRWGKSKNPGNASPIDRHEKSAAAWVAPYDRPDRPTDAADRDDAG